MQHSHRSLARTLWIAGATLAALPSFAHDRANLTATEAAAGARGEVRIDDGQLRIRAEGLAAALRVVLALEGADGTLTAALETASDRDGKIDVRAAPGAGLPAALGSLAELAGRRIQLARADGTVLLAGHVPASSDIDDLGVGRAPLSPPAGSPFPAASGRVRTKARIGRHSIEVKVRRLADETVYSVVVESLAGETETLGHISTTGGGAGAVEVDTEDGGALPFGATGVGELAGSAVRVLDADGVVVLAGVLPPPATGPGGEEDEVEVDFNRPAGGPEAEIRGDVKLEVESSRGQRVRVRIEDATAGAVYSVSFVAPSDEGAGEPATEPFAELTADEDGKAASEARGPQVFPFAAATLAELEGVEVHVRNAAGELVLTATVPPTDTPPVGEDLPRLELVAVLAPPAPPAPREPPGIPMAHGKVELEEENDEHEIEIEAEDLAAGAAYQVLLLDGAGGAATLTDGVADLLGDLRVRLVFFGAEPLPLGVASFSAYAGLAIEVRDAEGAVVLSGIVRAPEAGAGAGIGVSFQMLGSYDAAFLRGDANRSFGVDISDPVFTLNVLFAGEPSPACKDAMDANDDGGVDIADPIYTLLYLFASGRPMPHPGATIPGFDATTDRLTCRDN